MVTSVQCKSDYLGQLTVTPEMEAKTIKAMKDINHLEFLKTTNGNNITN